MTKRAKGGGRKRLPAAVKKGNGTLRADQEKQNPMDSQLTNVDALPVPVKEWEQEGVVLWYKICSQLQRLGILFDVSLELLRNYVVLNQTVLDSQKVIDEMGYTFIDQNGNPKIRPEVNMRDKAIDGMNKLSTRFGFTPADANGISLPTKKNEEDPVMKLMAK